MTEAIITAGLVFAVTILSGITYKCKHCGKLFSTNRVNQQGERKIICKHCSREM